jgi:MoaA/NifB/PqqE/SkfB family radical SAM enzyme
MSVLFAWPAQLKLRDPGLALTFVVPATACDLKCKFCAIRQRREVGESQLGPGDYARFLRELANKTPTAIASVQGYEPLLEESWEYTSAILRQAVDSKVPASLVTNGTNLTRRAADLHDLMPSGITVSLDSNVRDAHDRLRGVAGTFDRTVSGLKTLLALPYFEHRVTVSSVLMPRQPHLLFGLPSLLSSIGVHTWVVSPLLRIGDKVPGGTVGPSKHIIADIRSLKERADLAGIELILDDELGELTSGDSTYNEFIVRRFERPEGLLRLSPTGACSVGVDILREVDARTPRWNPQTQSPTEFLNYVRARARGRHDHLALA